jgi:transposase
MLVVWVRPEDGAIVFGVRPRWRRPRCGQCGQRAPGYDRRGSRRWRALSFGSYRIYLEYAPRRVDCADCGGVRVELVPWAAHTSWFTRDFEELVAYLAQVTDKTSVCNLMGISWDTVTNIVDRVVRERLDPHRIDNLRRIGIDEFSYRKHHRYLTVVVDHATDRVVWAAEGRGAETLNAFFDLLGEERCARIELVTVDMAGGYLKAIGERLPNAEIVFDRFHVQRLASDAVDAVRRTMWAELKGTPEGKALKGTRWALLKNPWNLARRDRDKLRDVQRTNRPLYRAYLLKETLAKALDYLQPKRARDLLLEWSRWAARSRLAPFVRTARTVAPAPRGHCCDASMPMTDVRQIMTMKITTMTSPIMRLPTPWAPARTSCIGAVCGMMPWSDASSLLLGESTMTACGMRVGLAGRIPSR